MALFTRDHWDKKYEANFVNGANEQNKNVIQRNLSYHFLNQ